MPINYICMCVMCSIHLNDKIKYNTSTNPQLTQIIYILVWQDLCQITVAVACLLADQNETPYQKTFWMTFSPFCTVARTSIMSLLHILLGDDEVSFLLHIGATTNEAVAQQSPYTSVTLPAQFFSLFCGRFSSHLQPGPRWPWWLWYIWNMELMMHNLKVISDGCCSHWSWLHNMTWIIVNGENVVK